jgi:hypothetical protein
MKDKIELFWCILKSFKTIWTEILRLKAYVLYWIGASIHMDHPILTALDDYYDELFA